MNRVTEVRGEISYDALSDDHNALDHRLHHVLALVLKGDALDMLMNQESGRGLACWRELVMLHEPRNAGHQRAKLVEILSGANLTGTWRAKVAPWERLFKDYESQAVAPVDEEIKMAVFKKNICPDDVRDHLCFNAARLTTYDKMKENWRFIGASPRWTLLGLDGQDKGKGDKSKKGNAKGDKGKGDKGKKDGKRKDKPADQNARAKADKKEKKCYWCGRKGHMQAGCYFKKEYEKNKGGVNMVSDSNGDGDTMVLDWVLAIVGERES